MYLDPVDASDFFKKLNLLVNNSITQFNVSCSPYIRQWIYQICEELNLKFVKFKHKVEQVICIQHNKCCGTLQTSIPYGLHADYYCPKQNYDDECMLEKYHPKQKCICIYKTDYHPIDKSKILKLYGTIATFGSYQPYREWHWSKIKLILLLQREKNIPLDMIKEIIRWYYKLSKVQKNNKVNKMSNIR
jgi:hypothetical protein